MTSLGKRRPLTRRLGGETPRKYTVIPLDNSISNKKFTKLPRRVTHAENLTSPDPILRVKQPSRTRLPQIKISQSSQSLISEKSLKHKNKKNTDEFLFEKKTTEIQSHLLTVEALPARLEEFNYLVDCVGDAVESRQGTCIYISGVPGTGKTASVKQAVKRLYQDGLDFDFVEINGMRLSNPNHVYSVLWKNLVSFGACQLQKVKENKRCSWGSALERLKNFFSIDAQSLAEDVDPVRRKPLVLLLDEFDTLISKKKSNTIYHFFEWIGWPNSQLILIAVANTMDLPERLMSNRIVSRMGSRRLNFLPYTYPQLEEVIKYSLSKEYVDLFNRHALEFCARKVSSVSGDARRALNLARRAIDIALKMQEKKNIVMQSKSNQSTGITDIISLSMIEEALRLGFVGGCIETIADLSLQEKIHLLAILLCSRSKILCTPVIIKDGDADLDSPKYDAVNNGLYPDIFPTFGSVCDVHLQLLRTNQSNIHAEIPKSMKANITFSQMQNIFTHLESLNLVNRLISSPHSDYETVDAASQVRLCVSEAEMQRALSSVDIFKRHFV